jgi:hypothetical protein
MNIKGPGWRREFMDMTTLAKDQSCSFIVKDIDYVNYGLNRLVSMIRALDDADPRKARLLELHKVTANNAIKLKEYMLANL